MSRSSPWGPIQQSRSIAPGIRQVHTASHGGYLLSAIRAMQMPEALRQLSMNGPLAFEEDCDWALVAISFPDLFSDRELSSAVQTLRSYHKSAVPYLESGGREAAARGDAWYAAHKNHWLVFYETRIANSDDYKVTLLRVCDSDRIEVTMQGKPESRLYTPDEVSSLANLQKPSQLTGAPPMSMSL